MGIWNCQRSAGELPEVRKQVSHRALEIIQGKILSGEYKVGASLPSQIELSAQLGVSRASLREALSMLETLGFLSIEPGRGTFISSMDPTRSGSLSGWRYSTRYDEATVFKTRQALECAIVAEAAWHIGMSSLDGLRRATEGMSEAWKGHDLLQVAACDKQFHEIIVKGCGNAMMSDIYFSLKDIFQETQIHPIPVTRMKRAEESIGEHETIIENLFRRNREGAEAAMRNHIANTAEAVGIQLGKHMDVLGDVS